MKSKWNFGMLLVLLSLLSLLESEEINENLIQSPTVSCEEYQVNAYRLPIAIKPTYYDLTVLVNNDFSFGGLVKINATVQETTDEIVLHYGKMNLTSTLILINNKKIDFKSFDYDPVTEKYTMTLTEILEKGTEILIVVEYDGVIQDSLYGFYKMSYINEKGERRKIAATQFQAVYARHAFPCFDEPAFKAIFKIRIQRPKEYTTLSNMPLIGTASIGSFANDIFEESVKMSTYLVAFIISELKPLGSGNIKVWTREDAISQAKYALSIAAKSLEFLEFTFGQKYQIQKLDMVALPKSHFGGMENWGLITYRESALLYDQEESSDVIQQSVAVIVSHECTHMWFGNLVTPDWWGFLWLSEGFAQYYQFKTIYQIEPTWGMDQQFVLIQQNAFLIDSLPSSEPLSRFVYNQSDIVNMADGISYDKGASILRMMELSFGSDIFKSVQESYLNGRKYSTGKPEDLFSRIQIKINSRLDASVDAIMNTWTKKSGYPVLSVTVNGDQIKLRQQKFFLRKLNLDSSVEQKWWIPITWASKSNPDFSITTTDKWINGDEVIRVKRNTSDWIIFNIQAAGFYRVNYDTDSWLRIISTLNSASVKKIHVINRATIIDDLLNLARANLLDYSIALEGLQYLKNETSFLPFKTAFTNLDYLIRRFSGQEGFSVFSKHVLMLIKNIHQQLGFVDRPSDDRLTVLLRRELNSLSCSLGLQDCISKSLKYFSNWKNGVNRRVPKNLKSVIYSTAIKYGTQDDWDFLWNQYLHTSVVSEQVEIINALACSQDPKILEQYLRFTSNHFDEHRTHKRDLSDVFKSVSSCSLFGANFVLDFVDKYHRDIVTLNRGDYGQVSSILSDASQFLSTQNLIDKFKQLILTHYIDFERIMPSLRTKLELAKYEMSWYQRNSHKIISWIRTR
ncbi:aminopeptidase Ey-like [Belonocnema kinseyi]|uniref:aminopeptidase Ey-like n=1 Tax=Belonocnema kinseyi TaxID=2817044 RepID=UPI00143DF4AC|nr:aminopeptidase Ey-like [Belonocnema kinseyi]